MGKTPESYANVNLKSSSENGDFGEAEARLLIELIKKMPYPAGRVASLQINFSFFFPFVFFFFFFGFLHRLIFLEGYFKCSFKLQCDSTLLFVFVAFILTESRTQDTR